MIAEPTIRPERPGDEESLRVLHRAAFAGDAEAALVDRLRADGDLVLSLVAEASGECLGHVAFSRLRAADLRLGAVALAPLAVRPNDQRRGIGSALVRTGLARLAERGEGAVLVLGDPAYYGRFGFTPEAARAFETPYDGPYLQALLLGPAPGGPLAYAPAFAGL